ncbi:MAG: DUF2318 domain-containing protein [Candidatus Thermoplasmatota archaeon]|nr:DUF2318 domain-containing protein [Candidatus Thermoplasmatota archaeon]
MARSKSRAGMKKCPVCQCELKRSNYSAHMKRLHNVESPDVDERRDVSHKGKRLEIRKVELARRRRTRHISIAASLVLIVIVGIALYFSFQGSTPGPSPVQAPPPQVESAVRIPVSQLSTSATFYTYNSGSTLVRYFGAVGSDGNVHVAADACDVCYSEKKGYRQVGGVMKCNNCGKEFAINSVGTENLSGGCWPSYLPVTISGGDAVIQLSDLKAKSFMFA